MSALASTPVSVTPSSPWSLRASRRGASRREVMLPCQAVRERDFRLLGDRTLDLSVEGMLVPLRTGHDPRIAVLTGETLVVAFPIGGLWIDCEATITRVVHGRRPSDEGPALGVRFERMAPSSKAALAGFLHGRRSPLPRRGPLARLRRGEHAPRLADHDAMLERLPELADLADVEDVSDEPELAKVDGLGVLRAVIDAWQNLARE